MTIPIPKYNPVVLVPISNCLGFDHRPLKASEQITVVEELGQTLDFKIFSGVTHQEAGSA